MVILLGIQGDTSLINPTRGLIITALPSFGYGTEKAKSGIKPALGTQEHVAVATPPIPVPNTTVRTSRRISSWSQIVLVIAIRAAEESTIVRLPNRIAEGIVDLVRSDGSPPLGLRGRWGNLC